MASSSRDDITALPVTHALRTSPHLRPAHRDNADIPYTFHPNAHMHEGSHASLQPSGSQRGKLQKRGSKDGPLRRKSTKKRKDDHVREEEIRAMSAPIAIKRPAPQSGNMMRRDSKKIRRGFSRHFDHRPNSDVSLPMADSIQSSMSGGSELLSTSYRVSSLDIFAPRPTIRYSSSPPIYNWQYHAAERSNNGSRANSQRRRSPISKETLKESKTIDDLADDMDAGTLRELMERDERRRERKRKSDEERLRRKLEKKAEKQRQKEARREQEAAARADAEFDAALGLGIEDRRSTTAESVRADSRDGYTPRLDTTTAIPPPTPAETTSSPVKTPVEDPVVGTAQAVRYSHASQQALSPPTSPLHQHARGPSNVSDLPELTQEVTPSAVQPSTISRNSSLSRRRSSDVSKRGGWWSTFKRRPSALLKRRSADRTTDVTAPSEISFSNTSRESMGRQALPPHLVQQPVRKRSGTPVRTMSKFREDLPERMPLSPPDSRVQSPEVSSGKALAARRGFVETPDPHDDLDAPTSREDAAGKIRTDSPVSPAGRNSALMSTSLASVDSEGSWLSGKPVKRGSRAMRSSYGSSFRKPREEWNASYEELGIPDDEYFRRLTPGPEESTNANHHEIQRKASSVALAANADAGAEDYDEDDDEPSPEEKLVHNSIVRKPTVVHRQSRAKSQEGLLSFFPDEAADTSAGGEAMEGVVPGTPVKDDSESPASFENSPESPEVTVHRASSVNLKNHVRQFSGSSAKLLDIRSSRSSVDAKRASAVSQASPDPQS